ncbi:transcription factor 20 [Anastrepha obliqua]|uniref:transcription factor 20 n=1 Tax=Anastrepha obliqua TaxID=95512 RepID=UPI00240990AC|nr:transcription factor 20 [Anastrepha obliqua]
MFHNRILMGVAHAPGIRLLRRSAEAAKFLTVLFLILTQNVSSFSCASNAINTASDGYTSWASTQTGVVGSPAAAAAAAVDMHRLAKRMDLELCLGKFEIHKNTIIRTGESQTLGGKYLQGLELDTAEECQRLCCETESCDVYVFEDKSDGYCYLFECGPPENFHCKFTRHANYTSAVLTVARHLTEMTTTKPSVSHAISTNNISQQEWELASLKVKPETRDKATVAGGTGGVEGAASGMSAAAIAVGGSANVAATAGPVPMLGVEKIPPMSVAFPQKVYPAHCGRFQFTCHSGECIAVYNACDGIPQCEDGSDEGPECSAATSTAKSNADAASSNALEANSQKIASVAQYQPPLLQQTVQQQLQSVHQAHQQQQQQQQQSVPQMLPGVVPPLINNREDPGAWANRKTAASERSHADQATNDVELNSRIFSHKGGIQVPTTGVNANNNPNSVLVNSYGNTNSNNNINNPSLNLNPVYNAATLQRSGIYVPQMADLATGGVYIPQQQQLQPPPSQQQQQQQQQQYVVPQGHMMMPPNVQWQMQQQQHQQQVAPQQQMQQSPQEQQQTLPLPLQPGPAYILNTADQQKQPVAPSADNKATAVEVGPADKISLQQQSQAVSSPQSIMQQSTVHVALSAAAPPAAAKSNVVPATTLQKSDANKVASKAAETPVAPEGEYDDYDEEEKSTEPPKKKHKHKKLAGIPKADAKKKQQLDPIELALEEQRQRAPAPSPVHEQYKMIHENLGLEFRDHDGQSERPGGAMLSLTLGLLVTAALAILIGCRMRTVGRRTRRMGGKAPYSHEADFLVNGMYL